MLLVETYVAKSEIEGLGLFAARDVKAGEVTWVYQPGFDTLTSEAELSAMPEHAQRFMRRYAFFDSRLGGHVLCVDDARFMNHAERPNTESRYDAAHPEGFDIAVRDIAAGEELTCDYRSFDAGHAVKLGG